MRWKSTVYSSYRKMNGIIKCEKIMTVKAGEAMNLGIVY